ncbi:MAG: tRNA (adenosine(37)-N6)-dimethylallyltransferase MiaA [Sedimentisphaerales bacterium]|nr:tRNA (adenosine(37)-N6)-dimethylallyltransferase MiaA [Sedimentisphaerales bacterium]
MILILGTTASGKSRLAFDVAMATGGQIISIDSMKVYRRMDIGTAKPSLEHRNKIKYHLIDVAEPSESFSVDRFLDMTNSAVEQITKDDKRVIAVGGTAMYIKVLLYGLFEGPGSDVEIRERLRRQIEEEGSGVLYDRLAEVDPKTAQRIHRNDHRRIIRALEVYELTSKPISSFQQQFDSEGRLSDWKIIGIRREKSVESSRINQRVKKMIEVGLYDEVKSLLGEEKALSKQASAAIGYAEIIDHLNGGESFEKAVENIKVNTRKLAKSQRTWFKTFKQVNWIDVDEDESPKSVLERTMQIAEASG